MARRLIALLAVASCAGTLAGSATAAAPRDIMVSGGAIAKPILLANQRRWVYTAAGSRPALIALRVNGRSVLRVVNGPLLRILERHAVPAG